MKEFRPFSLEGKVAIVTGASRGLGVAQAVVLARAGADVALVARNEEGLRKTAQLIAPTGRRALVLPTDLSQPAQVKAMVQKVLDAFGKVDILVNNAGQPHVAHIDAMDAETWRAMVEANLSSVFYCCRAIVPHMKARRYGRIINIASISAQTGGVTGSVAYSASKGGIISMTKTLVRDLSPFNITVNAIAPGQIETPETKLPDETRLPEGPFRELLRQIPLGRLGQPEDIAYAVLFLASDEANYITGATLDVNGGILRR